MLKSHLGGQKAERPVGRTFFQYSANIVSSNGARRDRTIGTGFGKARNSSHYPITAHCLATKSITCKPAGTHRESNCISWAFSPSHEPHIDSTMTFFFNFVALVTREASNWIIYQASGMNFDFAFELRTDISIAYGGLGRAISLTGKKDFRESIKWLLCASWIQFLYLRLSRWLRETWKCQARVRCQSINLRSGCGDEHNANRTSRSGALIMNAHVCAHVRSMSSTIRKEEIFCSGPRRRIILASGWHWANWNWNVGGADNEMCATA